MAASGVPVPEWRTGIKVTPWRVFLAATLFFWLARGLDAARDGRDPFDASVFLGAVGIGVFMTVIFWAVGAWKSGDRA
jgi:hypothetical protein